MGFLGRMDTKSQVSNKSFAEVEARQGGFFTDIPEREKKKKLKEEAGEERGMQSGFFTRRDTFFGN